MSDDVQRWKSKYLESLEQQEHLEGLWQARLDLLRRGLVRSSLAAEGSDKVVDQCMQELRDLLRRDDMDSGLAALIPRLEKAVLDSEKRRQGRIEQNISGVSSLTHQLLAMEPPREVRKALKQFAKRIDERAKQSREMPALLSELSHLQQQTLASLGTEVSLRPGLLQRLFGSKEAAPGSAEATAAELAPTPTPTPTPVAAQALPSGALAPVRETRLASASPAPLTTAPEAATEPVAPTKPQLPESSASASPEPASAACAEDPAPLADDLELIPAQPVLGIEKLVAIDPAYALPELPEPGYSTVAPHIGQSLLSLLEDLNLPQRHQEQGEVLRQRVQGGLNWYELVAVLDELAVLILAVNDSGRHEFTNYLKLLNQRLDPFISTLSQAHEGYSDVLQSARSFNQELRNQVSDLQASVQEAADLPSLQQTLETRLDDLLGTLIDHQQQHDGRDEQLALRLQGLTEKVAEMEREAQTVREHLEEQRQRSLIDPLTGLANRAGWNERIELEMARCKRYGDHLLLAVLDIDHFKRINDSYGHLAGDKVLKIIAGELQKQVRATDFIARFGGEEFVLLIPSTSLAGGEQLLQNLLQGIEQCPFHFRGERIVITLSAGLSSYSVGESAQKFFERADKALYRAKHAGRNRVELA